MRSSIDPFEGLGEKVHGPEFQYLKNTRREIRNLDGKGESEAGGRGEGEEMEGKKLNKYGKPFARDIYRSG